MMTRKELQETILKVSDGALEKLTDFLLWYFFLSGASVGKNTKTLYWAFVEADRTLEKINYRSFKRAIAYLLEKEYLEIQEAKDKVGLAITKQGRERLKAASPKYQDKRIWDKKFYLVTYDIPEKRHRDRDLLREYLRRIGCAILQESVWLTPYNPTRILRDFVSERGLEGTILVSDLGQEGKIGGEEIRNLIRKLYKLDELNEKYREFIQKYSRGHFSKMEVTFAFESILQNDPQLPFELLADDWLGEKAYQLFKNCTNLTNGRLPDL